jgi:hypothetical protein
MCVPQLHSVNGVACVYSFTRSPVLPPHTYMQVPISSLAGLEITFVAAGPLNTAFLTGEHDGRI